MGLIKAAFGAAASVLGDQWEEYFYCDSLSQEVLAVKGQKRTSRRGSNRKGSENIISNGSVIAVNEGQCMMIVDQGKVMEVCAEPGEYIYDMSSEPSIFYGDLGENIRKSFELFGIRFAFGGEAPRDQRVYYFNTKEIVGNKYGTANPVPFRVVDTNIGLDVDISIRCHGEYSYRIVDPLCFYANVCGNVERAYTRDNLDSMLKSELMTALQPAFAKISEMGIRYSALPGHTAEISDALNQVLSEKWLHLRGIAVASFGVSSVTASEEDEKMIRDMQKSAVLRNPNMAHSRREHGYRPHDGFCRDEHGRTGWRLQCGAALSDGKRAECADRRRAERKRAGHAECTGRECSVRERRKRECSGSRYLPDGADRRKLDLQLRRGEHRKILSSVWKAPSRSRMDLFLRNREPGKFLHGMRKAQTCRSAHLPL